MVRKVSIALLILLILSSLVWLYFYAKRITAPSLPAIQAIPANAALIIETKNIKKTWNSISGNKIWRQLRGIESFDNFNRFVEKIDSGMANEPELYTEICKHSSFITFHLVKDKVAILALFNLPTRFQKEAIQQLMQEIFAESNMPYFYVESGMLAISFSEELLSQSELAIKEKKSVVTHPAFTKVRYTAGKRVDENVFVNFPMLSELIEKSQQLSLTDNLGFVRKVSQYGSLDFKADSNYFSMVGYCYDNGKDDFASVIRYTKPTKFPGLKYVPATTIQLSLTGINDFQKYSDALRKFNGDTLSVNDGVSECRTYINSWIGDEMIRFHFRGIANSPHEAVLCKLKYAANSEKEMVDEFLMQENKVEVEYRSYLIRKQTRAKMWENTIGETSVNKALDYYCFMNDYVLFTDSPEAINYLIDQYLAGYNLLSEPDFQAFYENFPAEVNYFSAYRNSKENAYLKQLLSRSNVKAYQQNYPVFKRAGFVGYQLSSAKDLMFTQFLAHFNAKVKLPTPERVVQFEPLLASEIIPIKNTNDEIKFVAIQDEKNKLYVYDLDGKKIGAMELTEKVSETGYCTNAQKTTLLFTTSTTILATDLTGKMLKGFPIKCKSNITSLAFFDYDKNGEYRILAACENKKVLNYNLEAKAVVGWKQETGIDKIVCPIRYTTIKGMEYLVMVDEKKTVRISGRHNEEVIRFKTKDEYFYRNYYAIENGPSMEKSCLVMSDTSGRICRLYFGGKTETDMLSLRFGREHYFMAENINDSPEKEYVIAADKKLSVYEPSGDLLFETAFERDIQITPQYFNVEEAVLAVNLSGTNQSMLISDTGVKYYPHSIHTKSKVMVQQQNDRVKMVYLNGQYLHFVVIY